MTALKTISLRIRGATTELSDAGLDMEGMAESTAKLRDEILALSGVDIMLDDETFKSTYDIIDELSQKWNDLSDIQQASITSLIAGTRQGNVISALMDNFDIARNVVETSLGSGGSALAEHAKYMEGLPAKINQFKAAYEDLSRVFLKDNILGGLIDTGTKLINILTDLVETFGSLGVVLTGVSIAAFIKNFD